MLHAHVAPDGYVEGTAGSQLMVLDPPECGYTGVAEVAARADHVHPLNIDKTRAAQPIGVFPLPANSSQSVSLAYLVKGAYGDVGVPTSTGANSEKSKTYSLSNHVHPYSFCDYSINVTSPAIYQVDSMPDGMVWVTPPSGFGQTGNTPWRNYGNATLVSSSVAQSGGFMGVCPFPARKDHTHPLNVADLRVSGATGETGTYVKPVGAEAKHGTSPYYARVDHVHTMPTGNNTYMSWPSGAMIEDGDPNDFAKYSVFADSTTWTRGVTKIGDTLCGFKCTILTKCIRPPTGGSSGPKDIYFAREFTFDENGLVKAVSAEKWAFAEWNGAKKPT